jgi:hypothetical protein
VQADLDLDLALNLDLLPMGFNYPEAFHKIRSTRTFTLLNYTRPVPTG